MQIQGKSYRPKWEENQRGMVLFLRLQIPREGILHQLVPLVQAAKTHTHIHPMNFSIDVQFAQRYNNSTTSSMGLNPIFKLLHKHSDPPIHYSIDHQNDIHDAVVPR
jgi:hypothetical protein